MQALRSAPSGLEERLGVYVVGNLRLEILKEIDFFLGLLPEAQRSLSETLIKRSALPMK